MTEGRLFVLTIGNSNHSLEAFVGLLKQHEVSAVVDVRSAPFSRFSPQFNKESLERSLRRQQIHYVFLGRELGARSEDPSCYVNGRVHYGLLARTEVFGAGIERVMRGAEQYRVALMCAEKEPLECHRPLLVTRALEQRGVEVSHILSDGTLETNAHAMTRLLDLTGVPREELFRSREELVEEALSRQERKIAHVGKGSGVTAAGGAR